MGYQFLTMAEKIPVEDVVAKEGSDRDTSIESLSVTPAKYIFKLDMRLIPVLGCTYTILFLDRTNSMFTARLQLH